jgi:hypothetical protein
MRSSSIAALEAEIVRLEAIPEISNGNIRACRTVNAAASVFCPAPSSPRS